MTGKKITRREFIRTAAIGTSALALGACDPAALAPATTPKTSAEEPTTAVESVNVNKGGTLWVYWHPAHAYESYKQVNAQFEKDHPGWKVQWDLFHWPEMRPKLLANFAAGETPDLVEESAWTQEFAVAGHVLSLEKFLEKDGKEMGFPDDFQPRTVVRHQVDGETFGIQLHLTCTLPFYNMTLLEKAGIKKENLPTTWEEFLAVCQAVTEETGVYGFAVNQRYEESFPWFFQNEVLLYDPATNTVPMNNPDAYEALQFQTDLIHKHQVAPSPMAAADYEGPQKLFIAGRAASMITGPWDIKPLNDAGVEFEWDISQALTRKVQATNQAGTGMFIPKAAKNPELAWEYLMAIKSLDSELAATKEANMCMPRISWANHPDVQGNPRVAPFAKALPYALDFSEGLRLTGHNGEVVELYTKAYHDGIFRNLPANEALDEFVTSANELLAS